MLLPSIYSYADFLHDDMQNYLTNKAHYVNNELTNVIRRERGNFNFHLKEKYFHFQIKFSDSHKTFEIASHRTNILNNLTSFQLVDLFNKTYAFDGALYEILPGEIRFFIQQTDILNFNSKNVKFIRVSGFLCYFLFHRVINFHSRLFASMIYSLYWFV